MQVLEKKGYVVDGLKNIARIRDVLIVRRDRNEKSKKDREVNEKNSKREGEVGKER